MASLRSLLDGGRGINFLPCGLLHSNMRSGLLHSKHGGLFKTWSLAILRGKGREKEEKRGKRERKEEEGEKRLKRESTQNGSQSFF